MYWSRRECIYVCGEWLNWDFEAADIHISKGVREQNKGKRHYI
jgi:hypothetical protein